MVTVWSRCLPESDVLKEYEKVETFVYLNSTIKANGGSSAEIWCQISFSKSAMSRLRNITYNQKISKETRKRLTRILVFPVFLYVAETANDKKRIYVL